MISVICQKCMSQTSIEALRHGCRCPQCNHDMWDSGTEDASGLPASPSWFYTIGADQCGPITVGELRRLALCGSLSGAHIWRYGLPGWAPAVQLEDLCALAAREGNPPVLAATPAPQGQPPAILPPSPPPFSQQAGSPALVEKPNTTRRALKSKAAVGRSADNVRSAQFVIAGVVGVCLAGILLMWASLSYQQAQERKRAAERQRDGKSFTSTLLNAVKENVERGLEEAARQERLKEERGTSGAAPEGHASGTDDHRAVIAHGGAGESVAVENTLGGSTVIIRNGDQTTVIRDGKVVEQTTPESNRGSRASSP